MRNRTVFADLRAWLDNLPIRDPVDRRMAILLQFILLGFTGIILLALVLNPILGSNLSPRPKCHTSGERLHMKGNLQLSFHQGNLEVIAFSPKGLAI